MSGREGGDLDGVGILGVGVALPPRVRDNSFWAGVIGPRDEAQRRGDVLAVERSAKGQKTDVPTEIADAIAATGDDLFRGARERRVIDDDVLVSDLEVEAARAAMQDAGAAPDDIELVLVHSLLADVLIPSNAPAVQDKLGLRRAAAWSLDVGCASTQAHLVTAAALVKTGAFRKVLVVQSHAGTRSVDPKTVTSTNFGDGAAAAVLGAVPAGFGILGQWQRTDGSLRDGIVLAPVVDGRAERQWWKTPVVPQLASFDADVGKTAGLRAGEFCREASFGALERAGLRLEDVDLYVGNQSLGWFVDACRRALGLPLEKTFHTLAEVANIGDAAILFNVHAARAAGKVRHGSTLLLYSPSAGFTRSAVVLRWYAPAEAAP
jgi:3-oxoacyl-[acyl-carrier-protein] synthase-3